MSSHALKKKMPEIKRIQFQNSNAVLHFLRNNKMWINVSKRVLRISFAPCISHTLGYALLIYDFIKALGICLPEYF